MSIKLTFSWFLVLRSWEGEREMNMIVCLLTTWRHQLLGDGGGKIQTEFLPKSLCFELEQIRDHFYYKNFLFFYNKSGLRFAVAQSISNFVFWFFVTEKRQSTQLWTTIWPLCWRLLELSFAWRVELGLNFHKKMSPWGAIRSEKRSGPSKFAFFSL